MAWDRNKFLNNLGKMKEKEDAGAGVDKRFYKVEAPKQGKNVYRVRVLPSMAANENLPWVKVNKHQFKGPTGWFFENCPTTIGEKCPIDEYAGLLFNTGDPKDEEMAKKYYRKKRYIANILVVQDKRDNGANEGKVFLWEFGQKIYDKLYGALYPEGGLEQIIFMDPEQGYDLALIVKTVDNFPNYDESSFVREATSIGKTPEDIQRILESTYDLQSEFLSGKNFKSYEQLDKEFKHRVLDVVGQVATSPRTDSAKTARKEAPKNPETTTQKSSQLETLSEEEANSVFGAKPATAPKTAPKAEPKTEVQEVDPFIAELEAELNAKK